MKDKLVLNMVRDKTSLQFFLLKHKVDWNERYRSCGKSVAWETSQACRGGFHPPAESECLKWKSTFPFYKPQKS
ncbi:hypothetical protein CMV16_04665 [Peribacillus simplex]|nr:hypothetical protein CMV16_04665 [Peribacillus simplex]